MYKVSLYLIVFISLAHLANAQRKQVAGFLQDSVTHFPVINGTITNYTTKQQTKTDEKGFFRIEAVPNEIIYALAENYRYFSLTYSAIYSDTLVLYLPPAGNLLPDVTVRTKYNRYQLDSIRRKKEFDDSREKTLGQMSSSPNAGFGVAFNLDKILKRKLISSNRSKKVYEEMEKTQYIDFRFSPHMVAYYTGLKGDPLRSFMNRNQPEYKWLRHHPANEDVMYYINDKLKSDKIFNASK